MKTIPIKHAIKPAPIRIINEGVNTLQGKKSLTWKFKQYTIFNRLVDKFFSVRFIVTLMMTTTFCLITYKTLMLYFENIGNNEVVDSVEKIAMFILGAFCTQIANVITSYFNRTDRKIEEPLSENCPILNKKIEA